MKYFSIKELCKSNTAIKHGINNIPTPEIELNLTILIEQCLDPIRNAFSKPITITSGYRCLKLNNLIGGVKNSDHLYGYAADIVGDTNVKTREIFEIAKKLNKYTQLLFERNSKGNIWVHISYNPKSNKHQCIDNFIAK